MPPRAVARGRPARAAGAGALALPGALTVYASFHAGGFFAGTPALLAVVMALLLAVRTACAERPFAGMGRAVLLGVGALALYAAWTLLSALWSHTPARAVIEFDRALLYLFTFVFFASFSPDHRRLRWSVRLFASGVVAVCAIALVSRTLPGIWPTSPDFYSVGVSYPLTYSNAVGLLASLALVLCLGLSAEPSEPRVLRVLAAAALPVLGATLLLTFSRGAIAAGCVGVLAMTALARPRGLLPALLATVPTTAIALTVAYRAHDLTTHLFLRPTGIAQGHHVALVVGLCTLGAVGARAVTLPLDERLARLRLPARTRRPLLGGAAVVALVAVAALALALHLPAALHQQYEGFTHGNVIPGTASPGDRLTNPGNDGRLDFWRVALKAFRAEPVHGQGAGTYQLYWTQHRRSDVAVVNAHSLYLQSMSDLGAVGIVLVGLLVFTVLVGLGARARRSERALHGTLLAAALAWALHSAVDWDWQMPATTLGFLAIAAAALASSPGVGTRRVRPPAALLRLLAVLCLVLLAVLPARVALSQVRLAASAKAFDRGDCRESVHHALQSISVFDVRPEPYELIAYCDSRAGLHRLAVRVMNRAVVRDPRNWRFHYGLALVRAAAGTDPRAAARQALRLNPLSPLTADAVRRFNSSEPQLWERRSRSSRLPF